MSIEAIQQELMDSFDRKVEKLSQEDYRDLCENLASDFQCRYDAVCEEMEGDE